MELAPLTVLNKQYTIKRTLGDPGPFDIKYLGETVDSETATVIREFFPVHLVERESGKTSIDILGGDKESQLFQSGMEYFQKESSVLSQLEHDALPSGYEVFEANGTAYRARPHKQSMSLRKGLESKGTLSEKAALTIMVPILEALQLSHDNGLYHGGVSPETVRLCNDGSVLLTGFQGAFIQLARQGGELSALVQQGTSAIEQYTPRGNQGPWTDVYAAAATICYMVTGRELPEASDRLEGDDPLADLIQDADAFSAPGVREALIDALEVDPSKRLQSAEALAKALKESSTRYDGTESGYAIIPTELEEEAGDDASDEDDDGEVEVLSTGGRERPARSRSRTSRSNRKKKESTSTAMLVGIPIVLLLLGGAGYFIFAGGGSASYEEYRTRADSLYEAQDYAAAREAYTQALDVRTDDAFAQQRLREIDQMTSGGGEQAFTSRVSTGDSLMAAADASYAEGEMSEALQMYSQATSSYYSALDIRDQESVQRRINRAEKRQDDVIAELRSGGEDDENLEALVRQQEQAQRARAQTIYRRAMERGRDYMSRNEYAQAKSAFEQASDARTTDEVMDAIAEADRLLQEQRENQSAYERFRAQADVAFQEGSYEDAVDLYRRALDAKKGDAYAQEQLEKAKSELEAIQLAQAKRQKEQQRRENMKEGDIYTVVDEEAQVDGGLQALHKDVEYPPSAARRGVEGRVYMQVVVNADGTVREANVTRGVNNAIDDEALRVVEDAEFIPAKVDGKPVPSRTAVWIEFRLQD
ncbi:MAG: TonB family protein [Bacteroidetes bacterium]|jgi:TonB family protein|nr:TonB family protein [Bacteroidota bacterium]